MAEYFRWLREKVGKEKLLLAGTGAFVLNDAGEVLLSHRSDMETWGLIGGFLDFGETVVESMKREVLEETGLSVESCSLFGVYSGPRFETRYPGGEMTAPVTVLFTVERFSGTPRKSDESLELRFFSLDKLPGPLQHADRIYLEQLAQHRRGEIELPVFS